MGKRRRKKRSKLSPAEKLAKKIKRTHFREIRNIFQGTGFERVTAAIDKKFTYEGSTSDFDEVFLRDNVLVLVELTTLKDGISEHLKKKNYLYQKIQKDVPAFINFLDAEFSDFKTQRGNNFRPEHYRVSIVYASLNNVEPAWKDDVPNIRYLDFPIVKYFNHIVGQIKLSARFELFAFLGLDYEQIGENIFSSGADQQTYNGSILPEAQSHFEHGYKIVSFYVDPEALLERCYVLRKDGWRGEGNLYQRMIQKRKIESIRTYLRTEHRVFINNIIVTLPNQTKLRDVRGRPITSSNKTEPITIELPREYDSIGLIDGQHRVFSYYEGGDHESEISILRKQQNLLVTGIVYPQDLAEMEKARFEATLFLEINSTQTKPRSGLKQSVELLLRPFSPESIARKVVNRLNETGPLSSEFEVYFYDQRKIKTTSVVSYGVKPITKFQGEDTLFHAWNENRKERLFDGEDGKLLEAYVGFCASEINKFVSAVKSNVSADRWTTDKKVKGHLLTTTNINGFIVCLRQIVQNDKLRSFEYYRGKLADVQRFPFANYRSSQYGDLGRTMYERYFA